MELEDYKSVDRWLAGRSRGTCYTYKSNLRTYIEFRGLNPDELIDEIVEDRKNERRDQRAVEVQIRKFRVWMIEEVEHKKPDGSRTKGKKGKKGFSPKAIQNVIGTVMSFYKSNNYPLNNLGISLKAHTKPENEKVDFRPPKIRKMLKFASLRDRAIILTMFQSGLGVSEICNLRYSHVKEGLEKGLTPIQMRVVRQKTKVLFHTHISFSAINAIKDYLDYRRNKGEEIEFESYLFIKEYIKTISEGKKINNTTLKLTPNHIEIAMRKIVLKAGIVTKEQLERADINPARPHALRSSYSTILKLAGANDTFVEYTMGHAIEDVKNAYWGGSSEEIRATYAKYMYLLEVDPQVDSEKINILEDDAKQKDKLIEKLRMEIYDKKNEMEILKERMEKVEKYQGNLQDMESGFSDEQKTEIEKHSKMIDILNGEDRKLYIEKMVETLVKAFK